MRPRGKNVGRLRKISIKRGRYDQKLGRTMAAYLTQELGMEAQILTSLGVPQEDITPAVALAHSSDRNEDD